MNTLARSRNRVPISSLRWRELEQFIQYCAKLGMNDGTPPEAGELVSMVQQGNGKVRMCTYPANSQNPRPNPCTMKTPTTDQYAQGIADPAFKVTVTLDLTYPGLKRGTWPKLATVTLGINGRDIALVVYPWDNRPGDHSLELDYLDWPQRDAKRRRMQKAVAQEWQRRLRPRRNPDTDQLQDDLMDIDPM